jgi:hypothetical protein
VTSSPSADLDQCRAGQADEGVVALDHERALARQVRAAAGVVPEHQADARHQARDAAQRGEGLAVAVEAADAGGHEGARRVVHADQRDAALGGEVDQPRELRPVRRIHRARAQREVVTVDGDVAPADRQDAGHDRRAVEALAPVLPEQVRLAVREHADALEYRHAALGVLDAHAVEAAALLRPLGSPAERSACRLRACPPRAKPTRARGRRAFEEHLEVRPWISWGRSGILARSAPRRARWYSF